MCDSSSPPACRSRCDYVPSTCRQSCRRRASASGGGGGFANLVFTEPSIDALLASRAEYFFLALPHGLAAEFALPLCRAGKRVIDLSADFRLRDAAVYREFYGEDHPAPDVLKTTVYGLPELHRDAIRSAQLVGSAGCYPTSILLPLVPLLREGLISGEDILVASASGVSGAGRKADVSLLLGSATRAFVPMGSPNTVIFPRLSRS